MRNNVHICCVGMLVGCLVMVNLSVHAQSAKQSKGASPVTRTSTTSKSQRNGNQRVSFKPNTNRDPMLSPDDLLLMEHREKQRLAAIEAERRRKEEEERKLREEAERKRQWELMLLKDPSMLIRNKIKINGIIDKEVLIGSKLYTIGNTYMGAKIVAVGSDSVTFSYKGQRFVKKLKM